MLVLSRQPQNLVDLESCIHCESVASPRSNEQELSARMDPQASSPLSSSPFDNGQGVDQRRHVTNRRLRAKTFHSVETPPGTYRNICWKTKQFVEDSHRFLIFLFLLTISRPPRGVCQNKKSPSHFIEISPRKVARIKP